MDIVLFGAGRMAEKMLSLPMRDNCRIVKICDNDSKKWGQKLKSIEIVNPKELLQLSFDYVLLSMAAHQIEIKEQLISLGIERQKIRLPFSISALAYCESPLDDIFAVTKKLPKKFQKGMAKFYPDFKGETYKTRKRREREGFFDKYCQGEGLDIGYGGDLVVPGCSGWDLENGDAQYLASIEDESFDFVYSSHCLEHMTNVRTALKNWFRVVRRGGYLIIAVPHRDLYEKRKELPSRWNGDHKHMFLLGKAEAPDTLDIEEEIRESLTDYELCYSKVCDEGHTITDPLQHSDGEYQIELVLRKK